MAALLHVDHAVGTVTRDVRVQARERRDSLFNTHRRRVIERRRKVKRESFVRKRFGAANTDENLF